MPRKALELDTSSGIIQRTPDMVESSEVHTTPTINAIPRANAAGELHPGWIPADARTIQVRELDGSPSLMNITTIVVGNGDLENLGGGEARIRTAADASGGGGSSLTVQEANNGPSVANVSVLIVGVNDLTDLGNGSVRVKTAADASGGGGGGGDGVGGLLYLWERFV